MKPSPYVNVEDIPKQYGIKAGTVKNIIHRRKLPFLRPQRGTILFDRKVLESWIEAGRVDSMDEMAWEVTR